MISNENEKKEEVEEEKNYMSINTKQIIIYALSLAAALGFNSLIVSIFKSFDLAESQIIAQTIYVVIMFTLTLIIANYLGSTIK
jgi:hypothetical protein